MIPECITIACLLLTRWPSAPPATEWPQGPVIHYAAEPTEEQKKAALMKAYHMNGDSMVGWGSIDLSDTKVVKTDRIIPKENFENRFLVPPPEDRKRRK